MEVIGRKERQRKTVLIPEELKEKIESLKLTKNQKGKVYKLMKLMLRQSLKNENTISTFIPLPKNYIRKVFNDGRYNGWFKPLKDMGIVETKGYVNEEGRFVEIYKNGTASKSKLYRINPKFLSNNWISISFEDTADYIPDEIIINGKSYNRSIVTNDLHGIKINREKPIKSKRRACKQH
jgi:hypothetical protein